MIEAFAFAGMVLIAALGGAYLGHYMTIKGVSHVQPSYKEMRRDDNYGRSYTLPDPWEDEESVPDTQEESEFEKKVKEDFNKTGLADTNIDPLEFYGFKNHTGAEEGEKVTDESKD